MAKDEEVRTKALNREIKVEIKARIEAKSLLLSKVERLRERRRTIRTKRTAKDEEDGEG